MESGYTGKLYHCSTHAADVLRTLHVLCTRGGIWKDTQCSDLGESGGELGRSIDLDRHSARIWVSQFQGGARQIYRSGRTCKARIWVSMGG